MRFAISLGAYLAVLTAAAPSMMPPTRLNIGPGAYHGENGRSGTNFENANAKTGSDQDSGVFSRNADATETHIGSGTHANTGRLDGMSGKDSGNNSPSPCWWEDGSILCNMGREGNSIIASRDSTNFPCWKRAHSSLICAFDNDGSRTATSASLATDGNGQKMEINDANQNKESKDLQRRSHTQVPSMHSNNQDESVKSNSEHTDMQGFQRQSDIDTSSPRTSSEDESLERNTNVDRQSQRQSTPTRSGTMDSENNQHRGNINNNDDGNDKDDSSKSNQESTSRFAGQDSIMDTRISLDRNIGDAEQYESAVAN